MCEGGKTLLMASDMMITMQWVSGDLKTTKFRPLTPSCYAMFSGGDISPVGQILAKAQKKLLAQPSGEFAIWDVAKVFTEVYQEHLRAEAVNQVLSRYGWDTESFLKDGYRSLGPENFTEVRRQYEQVKLDCEFLVCGFDSSQKAYIFRVSNPGVSKDLSELGFWAIGSGEYIALTSLMAHQHMASQSLELAMYSVCEAKFAAEAAEGVSRNTVFLAWRPGQGEAFILFGRDLEPVRQAWRDRGKARDPEGIEKLVRYHIKWQKLTG
jgi:hypothetical protein